MRDKNLLKVNDHKRTMALLCLKSKKHLLKWDMASYKKPAVAKGNCDSIYCVVPENIHTPPPPPTEDHWKFQGGGEFKGSNFPRGRGVHGKLLSKGWQTMYKTFNATYDRFEAQKHTYVHCFETKVGTPGHWHEVNIISFNVSVFLWVS